MPSKSRMSVRYFVTFTTSFQVAPTSSRIDLIASMALRVCCSMLCGCTCLLVAMGVLVVERRGGRAGDEHEIARADDPDRRRIGHLVRLRRVGMDGFEPEGVARVRGLVHCSTLLERWMIGSQADRNPNIRSDRPNRNAGPR